MRRLQAIAQNGLHYTQSPFERERHEEVRQIAEVGFFAPDELPELSGRITAEQLAVAIRHRGDPSLPTWFA